MSTVREIVSRFQGGRRIRSFTEFKSTAIDEDDLQVHTVFASVYCAIFGRSKQNERIIGGCVFPSLCLPCFTSEIINRTSIKFNIWGGGGGRERGTPKDGEFIFVWFQVLTAARSIKMTVFWVVVPCRLVRNWPTFQRCLLPPSSVRWCSLAEIEKRFTRAIIHHQGNHRSDDGGSKHLWNVSQFLRDYMAQHPKYFQIIHNIFRLRSPTPLTCAFFLQKWTLQNS
jgi:hypothetical protein